MRGASRSRIALIGTLLAALALAATGRLPVQPARGAELDWRVRATPQYQGLRSESPFFGTPVTDALAERSSRQEVELRTRLGPLSLVATAGVVVARGAEPDSDGVVNELYYDATLFGQELSLGKKVLSWGVGLGFRPLDVVQREERRRLPETTAEGVPLLAWSHITADVAWNVVLANPLQGTEPAERARKDPALAIGYYRLLDHLDLHGVARASERNGLEAGAGFVHVAGAAFAWHGALLVQQRTERRLNALATDTTGVLSAEDPVTVQEHAWGRKAVLGCTWTTGRMSLLAEAWYDEEAYTAAEWEALAALTTRQRALLGAPGVPEAAVLGNIAYSAAYFERSNLLQRNVLLRLSHDGERWDPALDVLYTPEDAGWVTTGTLDLAGDRHRFSLGFRVFGGAQGAAYRLLPVEHVIYASWQGAFAP